MSTNNYDQEMQNYFNTLPVYVQETIKQTGVKIKSMQDLVGCANSMMENGCERYSGNQNS